jgi:TonB family protein
MLNTQKTKAISIDKNDLVILSFVLLLHILLVFTLSQNFFNKKTAELIIPFSLSNFIVEQQDTQAASNQEIIKKDDLMPLKTKKQISQTKATKKIPAQESAYTKPIYKIGSVENPIPPYPRIAKLNKYQGQVNICMIVANDGHSISANICKSSGYAVLDNAALETLKKWKFDMHAVAKDAAEHEVIVPIKFQLRNV